MFQMIDDHRFILERYSTLDLNLFIQEIKVSPYHYESSFMSHNLLGFSDSHLKEEARSTPVTLPIVRKILLAVY